MGCFNWPLTAKPDIKGPCVGSPAMNASVKAMLVTRAPFDVLRTCLSRLSKINLDEELWNPTPKIPLIFRSVRSVVVALTAATNWSFIWMPAMLAVPETITPLAEVGSSEPP